MRTILNILRLEIKSYLTNTSTLFWTFIYPILMLLLLVFIFSKNTHETFYFNSIIGLMGLLVISNAIFGLTQTYSKLEIAQHFLILCTITGNFQTNRSSSYCFKNSHCNHLYFYFYCRFILCV